MPPMHLDQFRLQVHPGSSLVARFPRVVVVVGQPGGHQATVEALLRLCEKHADATIGGRRLPREVARLIVESEAEEMVPFCVLTDADDGLAAIVQGAITVEVETPSGRQQLTGSESLTWVDRVIRPPVHRLDVVTTEEGAPSAPAWLDLRAGVVPGAGVTLVPSAKGIPPESPSLSPPPAERAKRKPPKQESAEPPKPVPDEPPSSDFKVLPIFGGTPEPDDEPQPIPRKPAPPGGAHDAAGGKDRVVVKGRYCRRGHFNHPAARYCAVDGVAMVETHLEVEGPRPALGVLVFDDGNTYVLETDYVIGRAPEEHRAVQTGAARSILVDDQQVSRCHVGIRLDGWTVQVLDLGSANGTVMFAPATSAWTRLAAHVGTAMEPGARVQFGPRTFVFESPHGSSRQRPPAP